MMYGREWMPCPTDNQSGQDVLCVRLQIYADNT